MSNWILKAADNYLRPVYEALHKELLAREGLCADETTQQVLHEPGKTPQSKSYMWLYRTSGDTDRAVVLYEYCPGRGGDYPKAFLEGFRGYLHTDGYGVYHNLPEEITVVYYYPIECGTDKSFGMSDEAFHDLIRKQYDEVLDV